jgi:hypothetical protein
LSAGGWQRFDPDVPEALGPVGYRAYRDWSAIEEAHGGCLRVKRVRAHVLGQSV